jgi:hypothetical protein
MTAVHCACAVTLAVFVVVAEAGGLATCLGLGATCDAGCITRSEGRLDGPATLSPRLVSHGKS